MEFLFELLFELFGEVLLQIAVEVLAEAGLHLVRRPGSAPATQGHWKRALGYALFGLLAGGLSLTVFPNSFMHSRLGRAAGLVLVPVASGLAMAIVGALRQRRGQQLLGLDHFAYGYVFALAMAAVRYYWAA
jgi:hypothetical protein